MRRFAQATGLSASMKAAIQRLLAVLIRQAFLAENVSAPRGWPLPFLATPQARGEGFISAIVAAGESSANVLDAAAANRSLIRTTAARYGLVQQLREAESKVSVCAAFLIQGIRVALYYYPRESCCPILPIHGIRVA